MAGDNNNFSHPFGQPSGDAPNRPLDISSDLWTPISTGVPMQGTALLNDVQSTAEPLATQPDEEKQRPAKEKKKKKKKPEKKKEKEQERKSRKRSEQPAPPQGEPRPEKRERRTALVVSRAQEQMRKTAQEKERRSALQQQKRAERSQAEFDRRRREGDSGDEIRRVKARRKRKRKRLVAVLTVAAVLVVAFLAALIYAFTIGAPIQKIVVTGESIYSPEEIITASGLMTGENMFRVSDRTMNKRLCSLLPYVGSVDVKLQLPDTLELAVTDTKDQYLISGKSTFLCVDKNQKILSLKKKKPQDGQFRLDGFDAAEGELGALYQPTGDDELRFETAREIVNALLENGLEKANILDLSDLDDIIIRFDGRINIYLGTTKNLSVRLRAAAQTLKNHLSDNTIGYLEITHAGKLYLYEGSMTKD